IPGRLRMRRHSSTRRRRGMLCSLLLEQIEGRVVPSFVAPRAFGIGPYPSSLRAGDFNGDGVLDLAAANFDANSVSAILGNGDGTFQPPRSLTAGTGPISLGVSDFNGDGTLDLVVANADSSDVSVFLGRGDGSFQGARSFPTGIGAQSMVVGEFNG